MLERLMPGRRLRMPSVSDGGSKMPLAVKIALGTAAYGAIGVETVYADAVRFDNDGSFFWPDNILDITKGPGNQSGVLNSSSVEQVTELNEGYEYYSFESSLQVDLNATDMEFVSFYGYAGPTVADVGAGGVVGPALTFAGAPIDLATSYVATGVWTRYTDFGSYGVGYIGLRFRIGADTHYGWIATSTGFKTDPFEVLAWGFERTPNTPIVAGAVPAPGTLAALAFGAVTLGSRGRRSLAS
jgi:hypothetical protein